MPLIANNMIVAGSVVTKDTVNIAEIAAQRPIYHPDDIKEVPIETPKQETNKTVKTSVYLQDIMNHK